MKDHREILEAICTVAGTAPEEAQISSFEGATYTGEEIVNKMKEGKLPDFRYEDPEKRSKPWSKYKLKCALGILGKTLFKEEEDIKEILRDIKISDMPSLPSDGSRGQWQVCQNARIKALEWLLEEDDTQ